LLNKSGFSLTGNDENGLSFLTVLNLKFPTSSVAYAPAFPQINFSVNPSFAAPLGEVASAVCAEVGGV